MKQFVLAESKDPHPALERYSLIQKDLICLEYSANCKVKKNYLRLIIDLSKYRINFKMFLVQNGGGIPIVHENGGCVIVGIC